MKYLIVMPDYTGSCIRDEFAGEITLESLSLPRDMVDEITAWHNAYRKIIPLSESDREKQANQIDKLDAQGLKIVEKLKHMISDEAKIKYFSEGKLKYL